MLTFDYKCFVKLSATEVNNDR